MNDKLPPFASQWIQQWKRAGPKLQAIRDEELRSRDSTNREKTGRAVAGTRIYPKYPERHGMVVMQRWWMRRFLMGASIANPADRDSSRNPTES